MNERFFALPPARQTAIINGALREFARYDYKKASVDAAAAGAGVSKALLFHYFGSKKGLYLYLYEYATRLVVREMSAVHDYAKTDFFDILVDAQMAKIGILHRHPDIMRFITNAYFEEDAQVREALSGGFQAITADASRRFLARADASRIKAGVTAQQLLNLVLWMADGFMRSRTSEQLADLETLNDEFLAYMALMKRQFYKEGEA